MTPLELQFPDFDPIAFRVFGLTVHWYAIMYLLAFAMAYLLMRRRLHHEPYRSITKPERWGPSNIEDILLDAILGVLIGGRLGYCLFYNPAYYLSNPLEIVKIWDGGMSFHGGVIGVVLALAWYSWRKKRPFLQVADFLVPAAPLGLAAGRFGNFINGELWGREAPADLPWGMRFPTGGDVLRHPSQLYEMLLEGIVLFVVLWLYARKPRARGQIAAVFLFGYGVARFIVEFYREPDAQLGFLSLGLSMGQWLSLPMIIAGLVLWTWARQRGISDVEEPADEEDGALSVEADPTGDADTSDDADPGQNES